MANPAIQEHLNASLAGIQWVTSAAGMHTAFLVAAAVALAGALIGLLIRPGRVGAEGALAGL